MSRPDVVIAGAGLIGLACALELSNRGMRVVVLERGRAGREASWAAAGMLAAHDPENPPQLSALAQHSIALYPAFLARIAELGGTTVALETEWILEGDSHASITLTAPPATMHYRREHSLDPRKLMTALLAAVHASDIELLEGIALESAVSIGNAARLITSVGVLDCGKYLDCTGTWSPAMPVRPTKGQMLRVFASGALTVPDHGNVVIRTPDIYIVPRLDGSALIGATVEDAGFDKSVRPASLADLRRRAAALIPALAEAPELNSWAGLRPDTLDHLPLLGAISPSMFLATGHFRNGILLAPGTAHVIAQLIAGESPEVDLQPFALDRFTAR